MGQLQVFLVCTLCEAEMWQAAEQRITRVRGKKGRLPEATIAAERANVLLGSGRHKDVLRLARIWGDGNPGLGPTLAVACARLGDDARALRVAREAVRRRTGGALKALGDLHAEAGRLKKPSSATSGPRDPGARRTCCCGWATTRKRPLRWS